MLYTARGHNKGRKAGMGVLMKAFYSFIILALAAGLLFYYSAVINSKLSYIEGSLKDLEIRRVASRFEQAQQLFKGAFHDALIDSAFQKHANLGGNPCFAADDSEREDGDDDFCNNASRKVRLIYFNHTNFTINQRTMPMIFVDYSFPSGLSASKYFQCNIGALPQGFDYNYTIRFNYTIYAGSRNTRIGSPIFLERDVLINRTAFRIMILEKGKLVHNITATNCPS